ncbi:MAG TPA: sigma-54 dependent transcriptional regulator [Tepidisphaeraceae bacterium]|nr:sigma-54 dependent transcriptional regulator [Tepidisphaeraceae bacterium]
MDQSSLQSGHLRILVIDDEENIRFALTMCLESDGHKVISAGTIDSALEQTAREAFDLIFLDVRLGMQNGLDFIKPLLEDNPWARIVVITAFASIETAVEAMKLGAADYLPKPFEPAQLLLLTRKVAERRQLERKIEALQKTLGGMDAEADFLTSSPIWRESLELARRIATANAPVLIRGERGTGRGRLARMIHEWSWRSRAPFGVFSADGKSSDAIEAELFGNVSGDNVGAVAFCQGGTLLLEEIGNLPLRLQPRIMTLLRDREFERQDQSVRRVADVRVIATTSADLAAEVGAGKFRDDLLMALSVGQIDIPPLRQRPEDVLPLAERYLAFYAREHHRPIVAISRDAAFLLRNHSWPGNLRELRNVMERAVLMCQADTIALEHLPVDLINRETRPPSGGYRIGDFVPLEVIEEAHIREVMASAKTLRRAAAILGVNSSALCRKLKRRAAQANHD